MEEQCTVLVPPYYNIGYYSIFVTENVSFLFGPSLIEGMAAVFHTQKSSTGAGSDPV